MTRKIAATLAAIALAGAGIAVASPATAQEVTSLDGSTVQTYKPEATIITVEWPEAVAPTCAADGYLSMEGTPAQNTNGVERDGYHLYVSGEVVDGKVGPGTYTLTAYRIGGAGGFGYPAPGTLLIENEGDTPAKSLTHEVTVLPMLDADSDDCYVPPAAPAAETKQKITDVCKAATRVTDFYERQPVWNSETRTYDWAAWTWTHKEQGPLTAADCGYEAQTWDKVTTKCEGGAKNVVFTDHYVKNWTFDAKKKQWVLDAKWTWVNKDKRAATAEECPAPAEPKSVMPSAPVWNDECGTENDGWVYTDTEDYTYAVTPYSNGKVKIVVTPVDGVVFPPDVKVQWQKFITNDECAVIPPAVVPTEEPTAEPTVTPTVTPTTIPAVSVTPASTDGGLAETGGSDATPWALGGTATLLAGASLMLFRHWRSIRGM